MYDQKREGCTKERVRKECVEERKERWLGKAVYMAKPTTGSSTSECGSLASESPRCAQ